MRSVHNRTRLPIRIPLPGNKTLHLGPGKTGQISDQAVETNAVQKLLREEAIRIDGEDQAAADGGTDARQTKQASTHGHPQPTVVTPRGNR